MIDDVVTKFNITETVKLDNGCKYKVTLELPMKDGWFEDVYFCVQKGNQLMPIKLKHKENKDGIVYFETEEDVFLETRAIYKYYFSYKVDGFRRFVKNNNIIGSDGIALEEMFKMSVNFTAPEWAKGRMMYHIFVDRFYRGSEEPMKEMVRRHIHKSWDEPVVVEGDEQGIWNNDFYGGDLKGIIKKLDYIQELGIDILYLSPVVYSQSTHGYDASDYEMVDPYKGTIDDLKMLCDEAHKRGMKVILDAVFNHTGSDSKYFNKYQNKEWIEKEQDKGAYWDKDSKYYNFYKRVRGADGIIYQQYWWGFDTLSVCDGNAKEWQEYITGKGGVIDLWFSCGIDGLRLDVADDLTDEFIELIRIALHRNKPDGFILGEVWENPMNMYKDGKKREYIENGRCMDSVMNYNFVKALIRYFRYGEVEDLARKIKECRDTYPEDTFYTAMNFTSTHDMTRGINLWDSNIFNYYGLWPWNLNNEDHKWAQQYKMNPEQYEEAKKIYQAYIFFQTFYPGILSIFAGDEMGVQGIGNLDNRKPIPWDSPDENLIEFFREIGAIRKSETFMHDADIKVRNINPNYAAFERIKNEERMLVVVNRTNTEQQFVVPEEYRSAEKVYTLKKCRPGMVGPYGGIAMKIRN
ncbi:MAG: alpha-amylase family glycosyl hydrolase [Candidatus Coprovivens sp.]